MLKYDSGVKGLTVSTSNIQCLISTTCDFDKIIFDLTRVALSVIRAKEIDFLTSSSGCKQRNPCFIRMAV